MRPDVRARLHATSVHAAEAVAREQASGFWQPVIRAVDNGLVVSIENGKVESTIGRVAWQRWNATGRFKVGTFKRSLRRVIARAEAECERLNA